LGSYLVGRTGYCIHPEAELARVPKVGGTKNINLKKIRELGATHVILNKDENRLEDAKALETFVPNLVITHPLTVDDNLAVYEQFGQIFNCLLRSQELAKELTEELALCRQQTWATKKVLYLIWKDPWMTISPPTYIASMLREVGLKAIGPAIGSAIGPKLAESSIEALRYPQFATEEVANWKADAILFSSEPYKFSANDFVDTATWAPSSVPRSLIDGEMLSWYGPRAISGLRYLRKFRHALFEN
jgi:ABC-type Fe3+-hydroxamate transport system substrate-binding protein